MEEVKQKRYLKTANGGYARTVETATSIAMGLNIDIEKFPISEEEDGDNKKFYIEETVVIDNSSKAISLPNKKIINAIIDRGKPVSNIKDALKILEDCGIPVVGFEELEEMKSNANIPSENSSNAETMMLLMQNMAEATNALLQQSQLSKEEIAKKELKEQETEKKALKKLQEDGMKSQAKIAHEPTVMLSVVRRRNSKGISTEKKRTAFDEHGNLLRNERGESYNTEVIEICFNDKIYSYDIGADRFGAQEGVILVPNVPWSIAVAFAERRYPQVLVHPETKEIAKPFHEKNMLITPSMLITDNTISQSSFGQALNR